MTTPATRQPRHPLTRQAVTAPGRGSVPSGTATMFLACPACLDQDGAVRCGLPAEVTARFTMCSTGGPLDSVMIRCPSGHWFNGPIEYLTPDSGHQHDPGRAVAAAAPGRDSRMAGRAARAGDGESSPRNGAPAYYLGRPARLWIAAMSPRRERTTPAQLAGAITNR